MNNQKRLKIINIFLLIFIIWLPVTAMIRGFIGHEIFEKIHPLGGFLLLICVATHIYLNRGWIKKTYFSKE